MGEVQGVQGGSTTGLPEGTTRDSPAGVHRRCTPATPQATCFRFCNDPMLAPHPHDVYPIGQDYAYLTALGGQPEVGVR